MKNEFEATYLAINKEQVRALLKDNDFELKVPEYMMRRKTFDFSIVDPGKNKWGRVRQESNQATMAVKEIRGGGINDTFELEMTVDSFDSACEMFEQCKVPAKSFQENYREVWLYKDIQATIDTWPGLKPFLEIESDSEEKVRSISKKLGFSFDDAVFGSIDLVYEKEAGIPSEEIIKLPEITFANPPTKK